MIIQDFKKIEKKLPDMPGVYFFLGLKKEILYIGKATSIRNRVKSYFSRDIVMTRGALVEKMIENAVDVDFQVTDSVLEALILESNLIKKYKPYANTKEKDDKSFNHVIITKETFPQVLSVRGKNVGTQIHLQFIKYDFGPYTQAGQLKEALKIIRKIFPYRDAKCVPAKDQIEKGRTTRPCFNRQIGLCPGVCTGEVTEKEYARTINNIRLFFEGKKNVLIKSLEKEMLMYAEKQQFEKAVKVRKTLFALSHIQDVSLIKEDFKDAQYLKKSENDSAPFRIEGYDIAHMSGQNMTGGVVVLENGVLNKAEYRKFKIETIKQADDLGALKEVLKRRFGHKDWQTPDIIVVDGNEMQKKVAEEIIKDLFTNKVIEKMPAIVAVVKNKKHKPEAIIGKPEIIDIRKNDILLVNNEAHRFVIAYHKKLRSNFLR